MSKIEHLFCVTTKSEYNVYNVIPTTLPLFGYSLIEIIPTYDNTNIDAINILYKYGLDDSDIFNAKLSELDITKVMINCQGSTMLDKLNGIILGITDIEIKYQLQEFICSGTTTKQKLINIFSVGVANTLATYIFANFDSDINLPFYPVDLAFPNFPNPVNALTNATYNFISYTIKTLLSVNANCIGKQWLMQLKMFWQYWGSVFPEGQELLTNLAIHSSISGFARHFDTKLRSFNNNLDKYNERAANIITEINRVRDITLTHIEDSKDSISKKFKESLTLIIMTSLTSVETIKKLRDELNEKSRIDIGNYYESLHIELEDNMNHNSEVIHSKIEIFTNDLLNIGNNLECNLTTSCNDMISQFTSIYDDCTSNIYKLQHDNKIESVNLVTKIKMELIETRNNIVDHINKSVSDAKLQVDDISCKVIDISCNKVKYELNTILSEAYYSMRDNFKHDAYKISGKLVTSYMNDMDSAFANKLDQHIKCNNLVKKCDVDKLYNEIKTLKSKVEQLEVELERKTYTDNKIYNVEEKMLKMENVLKGIAQSIC